MTDRPATVRIATPLDAAALFYQLRDDLQGDNWLGLPPDEPDCARTVAALCRGKDGIAGVVDSKRGIVASIGIRAVKPWFTTEWMLSQIWLFVDPAARGAGLDDDLFQFAEWHREDMSARLGYDLIFENTVLSLNRLPAKLRLWRKHGEMIGGVYWSRKP